MPGCHRRPDPALLLEWFDRVMLASGRGCQIDVEGSEIPIFETVIVPLDGSALADTALWPSNWSA